jgi:carbon-monoxide dehydrogenase medium subunit
VKPPPFLYARPSGLEEAVALLEQSGEDAKVLAGGQSLVPLLNFRFARPSVLVDLHLLRELTTIERSDGRIVIGSMVRQRVAEMSADVRTLCPLIAQGLHHVGHLQIRNRGTVGGSIAHADPAAELPAVILALDGEILAVGPRGKRIIPASHFFAGPFMTALAPDEVLTGVRIPMTGDARTAFLEFSRRSGDFALGGVAAVVRFEQGSNNVREAALAALGMGGTPIRLKGAERAVQGRTMSSDTARDAARTAAGEVEPLEDVHADAAYRRELIGILVERALQEVGR